MFANAAQKIGIKAFHHTDFETTKNILENLKAITVCVDYADYFEHAVIANKDLFDEWFIVTSSKDTDTMKLCDKYDLTCIVTDKFYKDGARFNKFAGINIALRATSETDWCLFLDADIVLHKETRRVLENSELSEDIIYGMDRLNCRGYDIYEDYKQGDGILHDSWLLHDADLNMGSRLVHLYGHEGDNGQFGGWQPVGFFQLAHRSSFDNYPETSGSADHCDIEFARKWKRSKRVLIPELFAIHLESGKQQHGINWGGRKSPVFEPVKKDIDGIAYDPQSDGIRKYLKKHPRK